MPSHSNAPLSRDAGVSNFSQHVLAQLNQEFRKNASCAKEIDDLKRQNEQLRDKVEKKTLEIESVKSKVAVLTQDLLIAENTSHRYIQQNEELQKTVRFFREAYERTESYVHLLLKPKPENDISRDHFASSSDGDSLTFAKRQQQEALLSVGNEDLPGRVFVSALVRHEPRLSQDPKARKQVLSPMHKITQEMGCLWNPSNASTVDRLMKPSQHRQIQFQLELAQVDLECSLGDRKFTSNFNQTLDPARKIFAHSFFRGWKYPAFLLGAVQELTRYSTPLHLLHKLGTIGVLKIVYATHQMFLHSLNDLQNYKSLDSLTARCHVMEMLRCLEILLRTGLDSAMAFVRSTVQQFLPDYNFLPIKRPHTGVLIDNFLDQREENHSILMGAYMTWIQYCCVEPKGRSRVHLTSLVNLFDDTELEEKSPHMYCTDPSLPPPGQALMLVFESDSTFIIVDIPRSRIDQYALKGVARAVPVGLEKHIESIFLSIPVYHAGSEGGL